MLDTKDEDAMHDALAALSRHALILLTANGLALLML